MATAPFALFLFISLLALASAESKSTEKNPSSPYLSPSTIFLNYHSMLRSFKIFIYEPEKDPTFTSEAESLFYTSLLKGPFLTQNPDEAHLFFVPIPSAASIRSISNFIRDLRVKLPYWNRTLGADHFYVSCTGIGMEADRNIVELKKNSIQISCFPTQNGRFIPHKDISFPPVSSSSIPRINETGSNLGYYHHHHRRNSNPEQKQTSLLEQLRVDSEFVIEFEPSDEVTYARRLARSRFCLFFYGDDSDDFSGIGDALRYGCVPALICDRPMHDLPFMDVLRWAEIAVFVGAGKRETAAEELRRVLESTRGLRYERMKGMAMAASQHFVWSDDEVLEPYDSFHTVLYQLWLRRHTIRYARREWA